MNNCMFDEDKNLDHILEEGAVLDMEVHRC